MHTFRHIRRISLPIPWTFSGGQLLFALPSVRGVSSSRSIDWPDPAATMVVKNILNHTHTGKCLGSLFVCLCPAGWVSLLCVRLPGADAFFFLLSLSAVPDIAAFLWSALGSRRVCAGILLNCGHCSVYSVFRWFPMDIYKPYLPTGILHPFGMLSATI